MCWQIQSWNDLGSLATGIAAISSIILLGITWYQIYLMKKQKIEEEKPRLIVSIEPWHKMFLLKITNVGVLTAYNINITLSGKFVDEHYSNWAKSMFRNISESPFILTGGKSKFFYLSSTYLSEGESETHGNPSETHSYSEIRQWLNDYIKEKISIDITYCDAKYSIHEKFAISDFATQGVLMIEETPYQLDVLNKTLKKKTITITTENGK